MSLSPWDHLTESAKYCNSLSLYLPAIVIATYLDNTPFLSIVPLCFLSSVQDHCKCCGFSECQDWCNFGNYPIWITCGYLSRCANHHGGSVAKHGCWVRTVSSKNHQRHSFGMIATANKLVRHITYMVLCYDIFNE